MYIQIYDTPQAVARKAADRLIHHVNIKPNAVLGLATGSSPIALYQHLVTAFLAKRCSFKDVTTFNLDEYYPICSNNQQSYRYFMQQHLFEQIDINVENTYLPECKPEQDPIRQGKQYEQKILDAGGIDIQLLGIGANGHIGFNEPYSSLTSRTRLEKLSQQTIADNSRLFHRDEIQPTQAMTMGIATILHAKQIMLIATGKHKAEAIKQMINGAVSPLCPASALQQHSNVIVLLDSEAASLLTTQTDTLYA